MGLDVGAISACPMDRVLVDMIASGVNKILAIDLSVDEPGSVLVWVLQNHWMMI
jgi:hypothetical protein